MKKFTLLASLLIIFCLSGQMTFAQSESFEKFKYISPQPGSKYINPENSIAFRHGDMLDVSSVKNSLISVTGTLSGEISGKIMLSIDERTLIFNPDQPYQYKEVVSVSLQSGIVTENGVTIEPESFSFKVMDRDNIVLLKKFYERQEELEILESNTNTSLNLIKATDDYPDNYPIPWVTEFDNPTPGYTFVSPNGRQNPSYGRYSVILDNYGTAVYYGEWHLGTRDFKVVTNNRLARSEQSNQNPAINKYLILDSKFNIIDTLMMGNGYNVDTHDMLLLENGNYFLMAYDPQPVDMSQVVPGGDTNATVTGFIIQELDTDDNVIFQWRSWDHLEITDATHIDFTESNIDYVHGNAFEIDTDENILMSCRAMDEITKIDRITGDIIWRFGPYAINNMFTITNDTIGFYAQHDIRKIDNGNITLYDNGNYHSPNFSQSVEYELDEENFTATLAWNYINDPVVYGRATGGSQRLANGNTLINWGMTGPISLTEVSADKEKLWEVEWHEDVVSYRGVKFNWVTDYFETSINTIDFGEYDDYVPLPYIIVLSNDGDEDIEITSAIKHTTSYNIVTPFPLTIPANGTANLTINFFPTQEGQIDDVLTLRSESMFSDTLPQMIARQIFLTGYVLDENPPEASINPQDGSLDIPLNAQVKIMFDESVVNVDGSILKSTDIPGIIEFRKDDATGDPIEYTAYVDAWKQQIVITPELESKQQYFVKLIGNTVADGDGNILNSAVASTFNTADVEAPVAIFFPEDSAVDVKRNVIVTLSFDEKIFKLGGDEIMDEDLSEMLLFKENDTLGPDVAYTATINADKTEIYILADEDFGEYQQYYSLLFGNMIQDEAGNVIENYQAITFTTGEEFGVGENEWENQLRVLPNPNNGLFNLSFNNLDSKEIYIYNLEGSLVYTTEIIKEKFYEINIQDLPTGVYIIKVKNLINKSIVEIKTVKY